jgi:hypothetical protein
MFFFKENTLAYYDRHMKVYSLGVLGQLTQIIEFTTKELKKSFPGMGLSSPATKKEFNL